MRYKLLYTSWTANQKLIVLLDSHEGKIIEFTLDELKKNQLNEEIKAYIQSIYTYIDDKNWEYH